MTNSEVKTSIKDTLQNTFSLFLVAEEEEELRFAWDPQKKVRLIITIYGPYPPFYSIFIDFIDENGDSLDEWDEMYIKTFLPHNFWAIAYFLNDLMEKANGIQGKADFKQN